MDFKDYHVGTYWKRGKNLQILECAIVTHKIHNIQVDICTDSYNESIHTAVNEIKYIIRGEIWWV